MSVVTVSDEKDVDWENKVPCPECGVLITYLRYSWPCISFGDFFINGYDGEYQNDDSDSTGDTKFYCPSCDAELFDSEEEAERFLLSRTWEPGLMPMPLERVAIDGVTYQVPRYAYGYCPKCHTGWDKWKYPEKDFKCPGCGAEMEEYKESELKALLQDEVEEGFSGSLWPLVAEAFVPSEGV